MNEQGLERERSKQRPASARPAARYPNAFPVHSRHDGPLTDSKNKMAGIYSFGHLNEIQASASPLSASTFPMYGYPVRHQKGPLDSSNRTTLACQQRDIETLWDRDRKTAEAAKAPGARPGSARPIPNRNPAPELEYTAPVPRYVRPQSARSYYHHQGVKANSLTQIVNATKKEANVNQAVARKNNFSLNWED
mmetsp:Transcript_17256/g.23844  ORF Transcript_17256/g.23844 Transcript_17256/m.23844 type:complete len:193 (+) Transcript_17256:164-742(+)|eukprot:CAMPEP_0196586044 /NCGR_PEP_ID=MMETSP1081-20130531/52931_1 /TAXON_ID=36882 /ORGANISM="Pyramimonas amylifera, Strain CCMP720" /LENGTH=192 /DNA_ID=CAMNT_0041907785 /DNA_START=161 /DNA_END=739 /DNA_ORIENTATION=-